MRVTQDFENDARFVVARPTVDELLETRSRANKTYLDFLKIDVQTGLIFTDLALHADSKSKKDRNRKSARKAYDTVTRLLPKVTLSKLDGKILTRNLKRLRSDLIKLGENV